MKKPAEFFSTLTKPVVRALEEEATGDPEVHVLVASGALALMEELLAVLEETNGAAKRERIAAIVELLEQHCVRGFSLGYGFAKVMHEEASRLAAEAIEAALRG